MSSAAAVTTDTVGAATDPTDGPPRSTRSLPRDGAAALVLVLVGAVAPLLIAHFAGALRVPRSDDWSYLRVLFRWEETGQLDFNDWVAQTLVGQVFLSWPIVKIFGTSIAAVRIAVAALGVIGLIASLRVAAALGVSRLGAIAVTLSVATSPLWGPLAATYMTDVPAFAFQMLALAAGARALRRGATPRAAHGWFAAALALAVIAFTIRQYAAITVVALLAAMLVRQGRDAAPRRTTVVLGIVAVVVMVAFYAWWSTIPEELLAPTLPSGGSLRIAFETIGGFLRVAGLVLLPAVIWASPRRVVLRAWRSNPEDTIILAVTGAVVLAGSYLTNPDEPFVGNYLDRRGTLADDIISGTRPEIMPAPWFNLLTLVASLSALVLLLAWLSPTVAWFRRRRDPGESAAIVDVDPLRLMLGLSTALPLLAFVLAVLLGYPMFDRYGLAALVPAGLLLVASTEGYQEPGVPFATRIKVIDTAVALALVALVGVIFTTESAAFDTARWRLGEDAVEAGFAERAVYTGYEWPGYLFGRSPHGLDDEMSVRKAIRKEYYEGVCIEAVITPGVVPEDAVAVRTVEGLVRPDAAIYARRTKRPCAAAEEPDLRP